MRQHHVAWTALTALLLALAPRAGQADVANVFSMPAGDKSLQFVTVGNPGNVADTNGYGSVAFSYQIGTYDVTAAQYCAFLNAVATTGDPYGLYSPMMALTGSAGAAGCGITQGGSPGNYNYRVLSNWVNAPVNYVSWGDAARFCNWLENGQPKTGAETLGTTESGTYFLNGQNSYGALLTISQASSANYWIPTENEWYKAAYYMGGGTNSGYWLYPTKSNTAPSNTLSANGTNNANFYNGGFTDSTNYLTPVGEFADSPGPYGTYDMGGDVYQWTETPLAGGYALEGGSFEGPSSLLESSALHSDSPVETSALYGFRVAASAIPEPATLFLLAVAAAGGLLAWRRRGNS